VPPTARRAAPPGRPKGVPPQQVRGIAKFSIINLDTGPGGLYNGEAFEENTDGSGKEETAIRSGRISVTPPGGLFGRGQEARPGARRPPTSARWRGLTPWPGKGRAAGLAAAAWAQHSLQKRGKTGHEASTS